MSTTELAATLIQPAQVQRDEYGSWTHPDLPIFEGSDEASAQAIAWKDWLKSQRLEMRMSCLENEDESHPVYQSYFEADDPSGNFSAWEPAAPEGEGWFLLAIDDTEDGPCAWFARRIAEPA